ncbi:N-acetyltransferase, partial [Klebsiella michiganensis]
FESCGMEVWAVRVGDRCSDEEHMALGLDA